MFIKLEPLNETEKAYQLTENCWVPKSVLDNKGLEHPYYKISNWWLETIIEKIRDGDEKAAYQLQDIAKLEINILELPEEIKEIWHKYWGGGFSEIGSVEPDYDDRRHTDIGEWELGIYD